MYRKYKGKFTSEGLRPFSALEFLADSDSLSISQSSSAMSLSNVNFALDTAIHENEDEVTRCWRIIEQQCWMYEKEQKLHEMEMSLNNVDYNWKTIRIFVSSTFTDFHNEREILVKKVFPALREWCESRKLHLVECDLRWGVPKDTPSSVTISTCMEELDRCHEEASGQPFFINMLSDRYGWCPTEADLPENIRNEYRWVPGISITHMEILHGAYRRKNPNAVFCLRTPSYLAGMPVSEHKAFIDEEESSRSHLQKLKKKLQDNFPLGQIIDYSCEYTGVDNSTGRTNVVLKGLDDFAEQVLLFFQSALSRKYPDRHNIESLSQGDQARNEENVHLVVMETKSKFVRGRHHELKILMNYAQGGPLNGLTQMTGDDGNLMEKDSQLMNLLEVQGGLLTDTPPLAIVAPTGVGKSAIAAQFAKSAMNEELCVLYHCVGCTSDSLQSSKILGRIIQVLRGKDHPDKSSLPEDMSSLYSLLKEQFDLWRNSQDFIIIIIDGIDEVNDNQSTNCMSWLPIRFPDNIRCIVTVKSSHLPCVSRLVQRQVIDLQLPPLDAETITDIVESFFSNFNKKLDPVQLSTLQNKAGASNPLWLSLVCEELRVFGDFRMLSRMIQSLPEDLDALLEFILIRLIQEDQTGCLNKVLCLIYCSQDGIPETEIRQLLGDFATRMEIPLLTWATLRRHLRPFIQTVTYWYNGVLKLQFMHEAVKMAVKQLLLRSEAEEIVWHQYLAEYYEYYCEDQTYTLEDMPYHMYKGGLWKRIAQFYRTDRRSIAGSTHFRQKYLNMIRCQRHTPDMKHISRPVKMCNLCANKSGLVTPLPFLTKSACIICGAWIVSHPSTENVGRVCIKHFGIYGPTTDQCFFCDRVIQGVGGTSNPGLICHMCTYGRNTQRCAKLLECDSH